MNEDHDELTLKMQSYQDRVAGLDRKITLWNRLLIVVFIVMIAIQLLGIGIQ